MGFLSSELVMGFGKQYLERLGEMWLGWKPLLRKNTCISVKKFKIAIITSVAFCWALHCGFILHLCFKLSSKNLIAFIGYQALESYKASVLAKSKYSCKGYVLMLPWEWRIDCQYQNLRTRTVGISFLIKSWANTGRSLSPREWFRDLHAFQFWGWQHLL